MAFEDSLTLLIAIFPSNSIESLTGILKSTGGNVERASNAILTTQQGASVKAKGSQKRKREQVGLSNWLSSSAGAALSSSAAGSRPTGDGKSGAYVRDYMEESGWPRIVKGFSTTSSNQSNAFDSLRPPAPATTSKPVSLPPLVLSTPAMIREHTHGLCELFTNVLPKELAARLFLRMVRESRETEVGKGDGWEVNRWWLADKQVESPHTTAFFIEKGSAEAFTEAAKYWYNGEERSARVFNDEMDEARKIIGPIVRERIALRPKHHLSSRHPFTPNVAAANCYRGSRESVGAHSDVLTYLGPLPVIASISLGTERAFRLRASAILPDGTLPRTLSISLPHNSLLIMHGGCQERCKHSVPPMGAIDLFRLSTNYQFEDVGQRKENERGWKERINITFRHYRPDFAPLLSNPPIAPPKPTTTTTATPSRFPPLVTPYAGTPICSCGVPTSLRPDAKGKARANLEKSGESTSTQQHQQQRNDQIGEMLYFWTCNAGGQNEGKTCGYFRLLDMKAEGRGEWFKEVNSVNT